MFNVTCIKGERMFYCSMGDFVNISILIRIYNIKQKQRKIDENPLEDKFITIYGIGVTIVIYQIGY